MTDSEFKEKLRAIGCLACGTKENVEIHHIKTRGTGGDDRPCNLIPLCVRHHKVPSTESWHFLGPTVFLRRYPEIWEHLKKMGWERRAGKLRHPSFDKIEE